MAYLVRMRSAQQTYDEIHKEDPDSSISLWYIRSLVKQGKIPVIKAGCKYLINYDKFLEFLSGETVADDTISLSYGVIRKVSE